MLYTYQNEFCSKFDHNGLSKFFEGDNSADFLEAKEREFYIKSGAKNYKHARVQIDMLTNKVETARSRWACISAKSQREKKPRFHEGKHFLINTYQNLTEIHPKYERELPMTAGRDTGDRIQRFTKRSRQRMLSKARKLNRENLDLPYFVTLTYQKNMKNFTRAKKDLNAFFQRFRRINNDFKYIWKMEPQKRGAIHFHLAFFPPSGFFPLDWNDFNAENLKISDIYTEYVRMRVSSAWNEVTRQSEGFECVRSKNGAVFGNMSLYAGTNVRSVDNWVMFTGYMGKYMKKEIGENPWNNAKTYIKRHELTNFQGSKAVPVTEINRVRFSNSKWWELPLESMIFSQIERKTGALNTGRYWGYSRNFDFKAIHSGVIDANELNHLNDFCNALNEITHSEKLQRLIDSADRAKNELTGNRLKYRLEQLRKMYQNQKNRYAINKERIKAGYSMQFEINEKKARDCLDYLRYQKIKECPFLMNYYGLQ